MGYVDVQTSGSSFAAVWGLVITRAIVGLRPSSSTQVRFGEPGAPVRVPPHLLNEVFLAGSKVRRSKAVVSHISRKTSEMWGTLSFVATLIPKPEPIVRTLSFVAAFVPWSRTVSFLRVCFLAYFPGFAILIIASRLRSTSSLVVAQLETLIRIAAWPCHWVPPHQQVPSV